MNQVQTTSYYARVFRRIIVISVIAVLLGTVLVGAGIVQNRLEALRLVHEDTLNSLGLQLETRLQQYLQEARELAVDPNAIDYASRPGAVFGLTELVTSMTTLINRHPEEYMAIRYVLPDATVQLAIVNENGTARSDFDGVGSQSNYLLQDSQFFQAAFSSDHEVSMSRLKLRRDEFGVPVEPLQPIFDIYAPVFEGDGTLPLSVINIQVDARAVADLVLEELSILTTPLPDRDLILIHSSGAILADTGESSQSYWRNLTVLPENQTDSRYRSLFELSQVEGRDFSMVFQDGQVISGRQIALDSSLNPDWWLVFTDRTAVALADIYQSLVLLILAGVVSIGFIIAVLRLTLHPILNTADTTAAQLGKLIAEENASPAAISKLMTTEDSPVIQLARRLQQLNQSLEEQEERRRRDVQVAGRIGRETVFLNDLDDLLKRSINTICNELGFYHAQVFLLDSAGIHAVLVHSRGEAGAKLLAKRHKLAVGSKSIVGQATATKRPVIVNDTEHDPSGLHGYNPLLPDTRAEMALPLMIGDDVIGVLDIQSINTNAFLDVDIPTYQLVADQLAIAIYNARLQKESDERIEQINLLNRRLTRDAWDHSEKAVQSQHAYSYNLMNISPIAPDSEPLPGISTPITIRGHVIGTLEAVPDGNQNVADADQRVLQAVAERVAIALENARLIDETQRSLAETSILYQLTNQLNEANQLDAILRVIIHSVTPDAHSGQIWLFDDYMMGEVPQFAEMVSVYPETAFANAMGTRLSFSTHSFLVNLNGVEPSLYSTNQQDTPLSPEVVSILGAKPRAAIAFVPLSMRGLWKGFIALAYNESRRLTDREKRLFTALIDQAGSAIDNQLLLEQTEETLERNEKLYAASRIINTAQNLQDLVYAAVATTGDPSLNFWLALLEGTPDPFGWPRYMRLVAQSVDGRVIETDRVQELVLADNSPMREREPEILRANEKMNGQTPLFAQWVHGTMGKPFAAIFPLFSDNYPIALFFIVADTDYELSADDYEVYRALTGQMSTQIENRRLLERTENALEETRRLYIASRAIISAQNTHDIYQEVAGHLAIPYAQGHDQSHQVMITVLTAHPEPTLGAPLLEVSYNWSTDRSMALSHPQGEILSHESLPLGILTEENEQTLRFDDFAKAEIAQPAIRDFLAADGAASGVIAAIRARRRWFGVIICRSDQPNAFDEQYTRFVQAIADQVAIALENIYLLREAEQERQNLGYVLSTLPAGVLVLDPETYYPITINDQIEELLKQPIAKDKPFTASAYNLYRTGTHMFYPDTDLPIYIARRSGQRSFSDDVAMIMNGEETDLMVNAAPIYDEQGDMLAIVAAFTDISNLRSLENTLQENLRETVALYETQRALSEADTLDDVLDVVIVQLAMMQPDDAYIILMDNHIQAPRLRRELIQAPPTIAPLKHVLADETVYLEDTHTDIDPALRELADAIGVRSILSQPLRVRTTDAPVGWLVVVSSQVEGFTTDQERMLVTLGDIAITAIDNRFLFMSTQQALQEATTLYATTNRISRARDVDELYRAIESSLETVNSQMYAGFIKQGDEQWITAFNKGTVDREHLLLMQQEIPVQVALADEMHCLNLSEINFSAELKASLEAQGIQSLAFVNLRLKDALTGQILLGYQTQHTFTSGEQRFLNTLADSAGVVLDNQLLLEQIQSTLQETSALYQASRALTNAANADDILDIVVNYLIGLHVNQVFIALLNRPDWHDEKAYVDVVSNWQSNGGVDLHGVTLSAEQFPAWSQLSSPTVVIIDDIDNDTLGLDIMERTSIESLDTRSLVVIPLRVANRAIGAIWIGSREPIQHSDQDLRVFQAFAEQASLSLEATRLVKQIERRARQLQTSAEVSQQAGQILDMDILLPQVVDLIREQFGYDHVQIFMMDNRNEYAELRASTGEPGRQLLDIKHKLARGSGSVIGQVTQTGQPSIALDTADANVVHKPNPYLPLTRSEMALPIIIKGRVVGALDVQSNQPNAFSDEDIQALTTLAGQIATAIDNTNLYEDAARRANDMSFLFDITTSAAATETLEESLQTITMRVQEAINLLSAVIYIPQTLVDLQGNESRVIVPAAAAGIEQPLSEITDVSLDDAENLVGLVGSTLQPQIIPNVQREMRYMPVSSVAESAAIVPISSGSELVGVFVAERDEPDAFNMDFLQLLQTLAGSLAAIIQNRTLVDQLQATNDQLREVDRLKSQFLANMSHELRTPLNSIIGFSRVMLKGIDGALTEMQEQDLNTIYNSGQHLLNLINDILDQAKIESGKLDLKFAYFDVKPMVEGVKSIGIGLVKEKSLKLNVEIAPNLPPAYGDEFRTRQILLNLVNNAVKFTPEGEINVRAYQVQDENGTVLIRIDVQDTGIGIEEKDMPLLFETFRQVDSSLTRTAGGTGLGLPISKSLAEMQGGELTVESELNVGSVFSVTVPIEPTMPEETPDESQEAPPPAPAASKRASETQPNLKPPEAMLMTQAMPIQAVKREILLIEDNKEMVDQFRRSLQREGFEVQTADHPAYAEAMASNLRPNVIVMDVNFANGEGWNILQRLKDRDDTFDIPIIISTISEDSERAYQIGAYHFIQRPFTPEQLIEAVLEAEKESNRERILIIDDQPESIRLLTELLNEHGSYRVFAADNGTEGISLVARRKPDLIILDLRMPDKDGFAVLDELRSNPETSNIPVLVVTGDLGLDAAEQQQLDNVQILYKTDISQETYNQFIDNVRTQLTNGNGSAT